MYLSDLSTLKQRLPRRSVAMLKLSEATVSQLSAVRLKHCDPGCLFPGRALNHGVEGFLPAGQGAKQKNNREVASI